MTEQQSPQESTAQLQRTTMSQGQEAIEQAIDLQRNVARMALSAMRWQDTAQQQGMELTKAMLQGFPGQQFTQSMVESYLQGLEAVAPEMERAMEKGMEAATQQGTEMGRQAERTGQQMERAGREMDRQMGYSSGSADRQSGGRTGGQWSGQQMGGQQSSGRQTSGQQYPPTGEWVSREGTYGGESSGAIGRREPQRTMADDQYGRQSPAEYETQGRTGGSRIDSETPPESGYGTRSQSAQSRSDQGTGSRGDRFGDEMRSRREGFAGESSRGGPNRSGRPQQGTQAQPSQREHHGMQAQPSQPQGARSGSDRRESERSPQGGYEQRTPDREFDESTRELRSAQSHSDRGHPRDRYSQRIDADRPEGDRGGRRQPIARDQRGGAPADELESGAVDADRDSETDETPQDDVEVSTERSEGRTDEGGESPEDDEE